MQFKSETVLQILYLHEQHRGENAIFKVTYSIKFTNDSFMCDLRNIDSIGNNNLSS